MKVINRYEDLTVEQFQKLEELKSNDTLDELDKNTLRLSIIADKTTKEIESLPHSKRNDLMLESVFMMFPLTEMQTPDEITLGGIKFRYIKEIHQYNICQEKDWKEMVKMHGNDYFKCLPELMAICHQEFENGEWLYNPDNHQRNVELFRKSKLSESLGAVFFYSKYFKTYTKILADCLAEANKVIAEAKTMILEDTEFQTFLNDGTGNTQ